MKTTPKIAALLLFCFILLSKWNTSSSSIIDVAECSPPDYPEWGGYGPRQDFYKAGDLIRYYCDTDTFISGSTERRCDDNGDWSGDTPLCDSASTFASVNQTSTADPDDENDAEKATDTLRNTCSRTLDGPGQQWMGIFASTGTLMRVSLFTPRGYAAYQIIMMKRDGSEFSCGSKITRIESMKWDTHICPEESNKDVVGIKIRSLSESALQLCEIVAHITTSPTCSDPHYPIENGRLMISRKVASLACHPGYMKSSDRRLECIRDGIWTRKTMYCFQREWDAGSFPFVNNDP